MCARTPGRRCRRVAATALVAALALARPAAAAVGGPDGFGYAFVDSREPGGPAYRFVDIAATGTPILVGTAEDRGDDVASVPVDLTAGGTRPGFAFYGVIHPTLVMSSNGYLSTDPLETGSDITNDCPLPQTPSAPADTDGARLYVLHDDLQLTPDVAAGYHQYFPSAAAAGRPPDRGPDVGVHVFLWKAATHFRPGPNPDPPRFDFQALLYDNGDIVFQYAGDPDAGASSTTGIQDSAPPTTGLQVVCNASGSITGGLAVLILNPRFADVAVTKTVDEPTPVAGDTVTYTVVAENRGRVDAPGVQVTDTLPAGLVPLATAVSAGTVADGLWTLPPLVPGASAALTVVARVAPDQGGRLLVNTAARTALAAPLFDGVPDNDAAAAAVTVRLRPPRVGWGIDADGDGFSDDFETAAGSDPADTAETPFGVQASTAPLDVRRLRIRLDFRREGRDAIRLAGRLPLADGFALAGRTVVLDVAGVATRFALEVRGRGARGRGDGTPARLRIGRPHRGAARFAARLRPGAFAHALAANAGLDDADVRRAPRTVRVTLLLAPTVLVDEQPQLYSAARGRRGRAREAKEPAAPRR